MIVYLAYLLTNLSFFFIDNKIAHKHKLGANESIILKPKLNKSLID